MKRRHEQGFDISPEDKETYEQAHNRLALADNARTKARGLPVTERLLREDEQRAVRTIEALRRKAKKQHAEEEDEPEVLIRPDMPLLTTPLEADKGQLN